MDKKTRIAIVDPDKCKPSKCNLECKRSCPVNASGKKCIDVERKSKIASISELLCTGCNICTKKCPFNAIKIINLPSSLDNQTVHRFGLNGFKLHRLPIPKQGKILGLIGSNGLGKSTAIKIIGDKLKPNHQNIVLPIELKDYFNKLSKKEIKVAIKPQYVDMIPKKFKGLVKNLLKLNDDDMTEFQKNIIKNLDIEHLLNRNISDDENNIQVSGGELQRITMAAVCLKTDCNVIIFDEPSSYLDIKQRIQMAKTIRSISKEDNYIIVIEHDLTILDYLSDYICILYGSPGCYGIVSPPSSTKEGINMFLDGYIPSENMKFRDYELKFKINDNLEELYDNVKIDYQYPSMTKIYDHFKLTVNEGKFTNSQITVLLGENGTGKTTFIKLLIEKLGISVSYKPQYINPKFNGTVRELLLKKIGVIYIEPSFNTDITKPLKIEQILDRNVQELSGGELQRVALLLCLGTVADVYLIDEPSSYLDSEQRLIVAKMIKRFIMQKQKSGFVVEHDFMMATYLADQIIIFNKNQNNECQTSEPLSLIDGMNNFLKILDITFRNSNRPRINKLGSLKDKEQKLNNNYFY